ncbi:MAG: hypothetical protein ACHQ53_05035 [Polyangiales bacterium]
MSRLLIVIALLVFVVLVARRGGKLRSTPKGRVGAGGLPQRLVCGACGAEFEPEKSGWICPKCGK